jgi:hypothetical protein
MPVLVAEGRAVASVVTPGEAGGPERFAVEELVRYVALMSGATLPVAGGEVAGVTVHVGQRDHLGIADLPPSRDGYDGYVLHATADRIVVAGDNGRGVLYGVYDLLERFGCRWYQPQIDLRDPEIVPRRETLVLDPCSVAEASPFKYRVCHPSSMIYVLNVPDALAHVDWAAKARYNVMLFYFTERAVYESEASASASSQPAQALEEQVEQTLDMRLPTAEDLWAGTAEYETSGVAPAIHQRGMMLEGPNHSFLYFLSNDLFAEKPEWFGMVDGVRHRQGGLRPEFCWSNAEAVEHFTDNALRWLLDNPHIDVCNFIPNDGGKACQCPECARSTPSDLYAALCNRMLEKLDDVELDVEMEVSGGYNPVAEPPEGVRLDPRIRVHWAHWGRPSHEWYGAPGYALRDNLDQWIGSGQPFTMVEYYTDAFAGPPIMPPVAAAMDRDNQWLIEQGVAGNLSLMYPHGSWWSASLNGWLAMSWYFRDRTAMDLLDDYARTYFGAAGAPMAALHRLLSEESWLTYWACGSRWTAPMWASRDEAERAAPLLDRVEALLDEAEAAAADPLDAYRLSRPLAGWRTLVVMGRARLVTTPLIYEFHSESAWRSDRAEAARLLPQLQAVKTHEETVVHPAVEGLFDHVGVIPRGFESDKLFQRDGDLDAAIAEVAAAV